MGNLVHLNEFRRTLQRLPSYQQILKKEMADPELTATMQDFISARPGYGKSKMLKRQVKRLNKQRKKAGLKKIKVRNFKLSTPQWWDDSLG